MGKRWPGQGTVVAAKNGLNIPHGVCKVQKKKAEQSNQTLPGTTDMDGTKYNVNLLIEMREAMSLRRKPGHDDNRFRQPGGVLAHVTTPATCEMSPVRRLTSPCRGG